MLPSVLLINIFCLTILIRGEGRVGGIGAWGSGIGGWEDP